MISTNDANKLVALIERDGFAIVPALLDAQAIARLKGLLAPLMRENPAPGIRELASKSPEVRALAQAPVLRGLVEPVLGTQARLVRSILFRKQRDSNWQVTWHQDLAIAVQSRADVSGFHSWSEKEGVPHVQPPVTVLEQMLTVRLHLDDADEGNGALWVAPGSHRSGKLAADEAARGAERHGKRLCAVKAGDALLMRPLLLHASRKATSDAPRRVIHLEFAALDLLSPLRWHESL